MLVRNCKLQLSHSQL
uniref:Uncharacterized protein n=1 Tax=Anguilla anguilla TaxID=7936 RepID=A0A0E9RF23_ANGAN